MEEDTGGKDETGLTVSQQRHLVSLVRVPWKISWIQEDEDSLLLFADHAGKGRGRKGPLITTTTEGAQYLIGGLQSC